MRKLLILSLVLLWAGAACDDSCHCPPAGSTGSGQEKPTPDPKPDPDPGPVEDKPIIVDVNHYILQYVFPVGYKVTYSLSRQCFIISYEWSKHWVAFDRPEGLEEYEALCEKYDDVTYSKERNITLGRRNMYIYPAVNITHIDLIADKDWKDRAAGTSWSDLCWLKTTTLSDFIRSGYTEIYDWSEAPRYFRSSEREWFEDYPERRPVSKPLDECQAEDMVLMMLLTNTCAEIYLTDGPYPFTEYGFTMKISTDEGQVYEVPVECTTY